MEEHEKPWNPLSVGEVAVLFENAAFPRWIAGGIAIELAIGDAVRLHSDIDILVLRRDHRSVREHLRDWDCWAVDPPGKLRPWPEGEVLGSTVHDIWCRRGASDDWRIQLMFDESEGSDWVSRRNNQIRAPLQEITRKTPMGVPYLAPHVQLFYKAKNIRDKDQIDFDAVVDSDIDMNTTWLRKSILACYGGDHPWLTRLH